MGKYLDNLMIDFLEKHPRIVNFCGINEKNRVRTIEDIKTLDYTKNDFFGLLKKEKDEVVYSVLEKKFNELDLGLNFSRGLKQNNKFNYLRIPFKKHKQPNESYLMIFDLPYKRGEENQLIMQFIFDIANQVADNFNLQESYAKINLVFTGQFFHSNIRLNSGLIGPQMKVGYQIDYIKDQSYFKN